MSPSTNDSRDQLLHCRSLVLVFGEPRTHFPSDTICARASSSTNDALCSIYPQVHPSEYTITGVTGVDSTDEQCDVQELATA